MLRQVSYIIADLEVCHGKPVFAGTRIMVWQVLELLAGGEKPEEIYSAYPTLPTGAVEVALHYAAEKAKGMTYVPFRKENRFPTQVFA